MKVDNKDDGPYNISRKVKFASNESPKKQNSEKNLMKNRASAKFVDDNAEPVIRMGTMTSQDYTRSLSSKLQDTKQHGDLRASKVIRFGTQPQNKAL